MWLLALVAVALLPSGAGADNATVTGSWYNAAQPGPQPPPVGAPPPVPTPDVPSGDFPVQAAPVANPNQADNPQSTKETYLHVDLSTAATGSTLSTLSVTLKEDTTAGNANAAAAKIDAHLVTDYFPDGQVSRPYAERPRYDSARVGGTRAADGTWTFDLSSLVSGKDVSSFQGVALVPVASQPSDAFEVVWSGANPAPAATYTVAAPAASSGSDSFGTPAAPAAGTDTSGASSSGTSSSPLSSAAPLSSSGAFLNPPPPVTTPSAPVAAPPGPAAAPAPAIRTRRAVATSKHGLALVMLPAAIALLALLFGAGVALGDAGEPVPNRQGSVVRRLERRHELPA